MLSLLHSLSFPNAPLSEQQEKLGLESPPSSSSRPTFVVFQRELGAVGSSASSRGGNRIQTNEWKINISAPKCRVKGWELIHPCCCDIQTIPSRLSVLQTSLHLRAWGLDKSPAQNPKTFCICLNQNGRGKTSGWVCWLEAAEFEKLEHPHGMLNPQQCPLDCTTLSPALDQTFPTSIPSSARTTLSAGTGTSQTRSFITCSH